MNELGKYENNLIIPCSGYDYAGSWSSEEEPMGGGGQDETSSPRMDDGTILWSTFPVMENFENHAYIDFAYNVHLLHSKLTASRC